MTQEVQANGVSTVPSAKTPHQQRIEEFMQKAGQDLPASPTVPNTAQRLLRIKLITEELFETASAFGIGFAIKVENRFQPIDLSDISYFTQPNAMNLTKAVDGLADLSVVVIGSLSALGVADEAVLEEVDRNNLAKFAPGAYKNSDGKWIKPPGFTPPDFEKILKEQGWKNGEHLHVPD